MSTLARGRAALRRAVGDPLDAAGWMRPGDRPRYLAEKRVAAVVALAAVAVFFPDLGDRRALLVGVLLLVNVPLIVLIERRVPSPHTDRAHLWHDIAATLTLVAIAPMTWTVGLVVGMMLIVAAAAILAMTEYSALAAVFLGVMTAIAIVAGVPDAELPLLTAAFTVGPIGSYGRWYRRQFETAAGRTNMLIESSSALFFELDGTTLQILALRGQVERILGADEDNAANEQLTRRLHHEDRVQIQTFAAEDQVTTTVRYHHPDGELRWLRLLTQRTTTEAGPVIAGVAIDVTALEKSKQELRRRAEHDTLTGLRNRAVFVDSLRRALRVHPDRVAVAIVDLDDFKWINDTMGHPAGDALLQLVGEELAARETEGLLICRLGGDEFGLLVEDDEPRRRAFAAAEQVRAAFGATHTIERVDLQLRASIGIAVGWQGATSRDLLRDADIAMYEAKRTRIGIQVFSKRPASLTSGQLDTVSRLTRSLEQEVTLWFQPVVDLATRRIVSVEGLARWQHPELGILTPPSFLPAVDRGGLSERLDWLALETASAFAADAQRQGSPIEVAVNMTASGLRSSQLLPTLRSLAADGHPIQQLTIEISERDIHQDISGLEATLAAIRDLGLGLALDDYGTGFSSLIRLRNVPFTQVKIDRSFIMNLAEDRTDMAIVRSTLDLASELSLCTVAEGVEQEITTEVLLDLGCDRGQGFCFAMPRPPSEILLALAEQLRSPGGQPVAASPHP